MPGKTKQVLDWPDKFILTLVDILETEVWEGAEPVVNASEANTDEFPEGSAEPLDSNIL